jgi:hypothetical protein
MKYFRHYLGHNKVPRNEFLIYGSYAETASAAAENLHYVLYEKDRREEEGPADPNAFFEYIDERDLNTGEEVTGHLYMYAPQEGTDPPVYPEQPTVIVKS